MKLYRNYAYPAMYYLEYDSYTVFKLTMPSYGSEFEVERVDRIGDGPVVKASGVTPEHFELILEAAYDAGFENGYNEGQMD